MNPGMRSLYYACIICLAFFSCSKDEQPGIRSIDSDIIVSMREGLSPLGRQMQFQSRTAKAQECYNYKIVSSCDKEGNQVVVNYKGIYSPDIICLDAFGPATSAPAFSISEGVYHITLINENVSNTVLLTADDEKYVLEPQQLENIMIEMDTLMRVPEYTYWLTVYSNDPFEAEAESFRNKLLSLDVDFKSYKDGDYGHFIISGGDIVSALPYGYDPGHIRMIFEFTGSIMEVKNLVSEFIRDNGTNISISIYNYQGRVINSWEL